LLPRRYSILRYYLKIPVITNLLKRRGRYRLRRIMRGYRFLKASKSLSRIADINRALTNQRLDINKGHFSEHFFGAGLGQAERVCRQYLLTRVAGLNLNRALLLAFGKPGSTVIHYLPPAWRGIIRKQGFKIAPFCGALLWQVFIGIMLVYGIFNITRIFFAGIKASLKQSSWQLGRYSYFDSLTQGCLPQPSKDGRSHDIVTWYMQWAGRKPVVDTLCHGVSGAAQRAVNGIPVIPVPAPLPSLMHFGSLTRFVIWSIWAILTAIFDFFRGRWWHALLLNQAALAAQVRFQNPNQLAQDYLFHNSGWIYRPLWTYEAERIGARITFYFYSTNCEAFKRPDGYPALSYGWQAMNWPHYLVWDEFQADFVRSAVGAAANISVVGQIWFHCSAEEMPTFSGRGIAVFDITPHRSSRYRTLGLDFEYYLPEICIPFLTDIQYAVEDAGHTMLWKRKRKIGSIAHPRYRYYADQVSECKNIVIIDPDISAHRVIEASNAVISMPFTSTALIARELGKPTCYYDPSGLVQQDDRAAHGIEVLRGPQELAGWLKKCVA
jgi:polysaccharide biosynthesis PFTS motif protein